MKCPVCKEINLVMSEKQGVEIDYCPECRGVWLDRGELDKIIVKNNSELNYQSQEQQNNKHTTYYNENNSSSHKENESHNNQSNNNQNERKKESFMSNVFDMFGGD